ncbi:MAG: GIDE domain-containing protein [Nevskiales bacterium]
MEFDADELFFLGASVIAAFYFSFRFLRHTRLIEDTPTSRVRSAPQGYVELEGTGHLLEGTTIACPLTRTDCLWWFYEIEKKVRRNKSTSWDSIDKKTSDAPFYLEDDSGRCVINPVGAEVVTTFRRVWYGNAAWPAGLPSDAGYFNFGSYRYTERLIEPGTHLYALGLFKTQNMVMDTAEERAALRAKLAEWKQDSERVKLLDVNRDGKLDIKEWEAARIVALKELQREHQTLASEGLHTLSKPEQGNQPYLLSTVLQKDLCRRWRWYAALCFAWFLLGGSVFVWQMIVYGLL